MGRVLDQGDLPFDGEGEEPLSAPEKEFRAFHEDNPRVWLMFESLTLELLAEARRAGRTTGVRIGAKLIWEMLRWRTSLATRGQRFKLQNNFTPYYARMFRRRHPHLGELFATRPTKSEREEVNQE